MRALNFVTCQLKLPLSGRFLWSDSKCVLYWIRSTKLLAVFVENRVHELRQEPDVTFNYVRSADNPADLITRGLSVPELTDTDKWQHGPTWLRQASSEWPRDVVVTPDDVGEAEMEVRGPPVAHHAALVSDRKSVV